MQLAAQIGTVFTAHGQYTTGLILMLIYITQQTPMCYPWGRAVWGCVGDDQSDGPARGLGEDRGGVPSMVGVAPSMVGAGVVAANLHTLP